MRAWWVAWIGIGWIAAASVALAQGTDVVMLSNGGRLRGTVEVYEPGADVVIVLSDGTRRTVPAAEVAQVIFGDAGAPTEPPPTESPTSPPNPVLPLPTEPAPLAPSPPPTVLTPIPSPSAPTPGPSPSPLPDAPGDPPMPGVQHLGAVASIAGVPEGAPRTYEPGEAASAEWLDDPALYEGPPGIFHMGIEARGTFRLAFNEPRPGFGQAMGAQLGGDLSAVIDLRAASRFHLRLAGLVGLIESVTLTAGGPANVDIGLVHFGIRPMLGFDCARFFQLRIGGEVGGDYVPQFDVVYLYGGPVVDMVGLVTDDRRLEMGLGLAFIRSGACRPESTFGGAYCYEMGSLRAQLIVGYQF
jgi:hypothetical protein